VEQARDQVAALVNAHPSQVIFTSGGTEANNLALKGVMAQHPGGRLAVSAIEHASVMAPARALASQGWGLDIIGVDDQGRVTPEAVEAIGSGQPRLVSVMAANNETGVIQDVASLSAVARRAGALFHCDAVQAAGKLPLDFAASGVHFMTLSAHKIYGPKGVGALIVAPGVTLWPLLHGGGQERDLRGGTEHVAGIVGFGAAAVLAGQEMSARSATCLQMRQYFEQRLAETVPEVVVVSAQAARLPNTVMVLVPGIDGETLLMQLDQAGIAVSSGSACSAGSTDPSHVLVAMGLVGEAGRSAIRVSLGHGNTSAEVDTLVTTLAGVRKQLRASSLTAWV